jgi:integrase/recombinase XerD
MIMLTKHVERYLSLRQSLGFKLSTASRHLRAFARFAVQHGETHIRLATAVDWAMEASTPGARRSRLRDVERFARFLQAEDPVHEIPSSNLFYLPRRRSLPYIYSTDELARIVKTTSQLRQSYPLRRETYATLLGLIAATGIRISEALNLKLSDVLADGILRIERTKFAKSRLIPLHPSVIDALDRYMRLRCKLAVTDDHLFLSARKKRIDPSTVYLAFRLVLRLADITPERNRPPRIHDMRHSFATRALQECMTRSPDVADHFVALSTYMGHADIASTYWYLEATAELMGDISTLAEALVAGESA